MNAYWYDHPNILKCCRHVAAGGVIAYPTESVWGLGCDPDNADAISDVLAYKGRSWRKGLILVAADIAQFDFFLHDLEPQQLQQLNETWPGPNTWLVPHRGRVSPLVTGQHKNVALRVSNHPIVAALCRRFGGPMVSTSANPQGYAAAKTGLTARRYFRNQALVYSPGRVGGSKNPSCIRELSSGRIIRAA